MKILNFCRNSMMRAPDENSIALASMFDNAVAYDLCMLKKECDEAKQSCEIKTYNSLYHFNKNRVSLFR